MRRDWDRCPLKVVLYAALKETHLRGAAATASCTSSPHCQTRELTVSFGFEMIARLRVQGHAELNTTGFARTHLVTNQSPRL